MKAGWEVKPLGEVCEVQNGGTPKSNIAEYWGDEVPWLTPKDMGQQTTAYIGDTPRKISELGLSKCSAKRVPVGSVIMSTRAPIGHLSINTVPMAFNQGCRGITPPDYVELKYLFYFLTANIEALQELGTGATFKELSAGALKGFEIPIPPLEEQKQIVAVLDAAFEGLTRAKENAEANLQNARELMEQRKRLSFSKPENGWTSKTLSEVCEKITDGTHQTPKYFNDGVIFLSSKNVTSGKVDWQNVKFIDEKQHLEMHKRVAPRIGDILLAKNGTTGVAAMVDRDVVFDIYVSLAHLRSLGAVSPEYLLHFVNSPIAKEQFNKRLKGTGVPNLHLKEIRDVTISFPTDVDGQETVVRELTADLHKFETLEAEYQTKLTDIADLRQSLLQKAFAGELT